MYNCTISFDFGLSCRNEYKLIDWLYWLGGQRARLSRLATRYVHIVPHYRTPLSYPTIRSWFAGCRVYRPFTIQNKSLVSAQLFWPGKQTVSRRSTSHVCLYTTPRWSYLYVRFKTALRLSISQKRDSGCMYVIFKTHLFASLDMPISKRRLKKALRLSTSKFAWKTFEKPDSSQKFAR